VNDKPAYLQAPARLDYGPGGPLGVEVMSRWRWLAPVVVILIVGVTNLQHRQHPAVVAVIWVFMASGLATQFTKEQSERALRDRKFMRTPIALAHLVALLALFGTSAALAFLQQSGPDGPLGLFIALMSLTRLLPLPATVAVALVNAGVVGLSESVGHGKPLNGVLAGFLFSAAFAIITLVTWTRIGSEQTAELEKQNVALAERQRLAREMHDVLAHSLSGLMLQLEGARMLAKDNPADPRLPEIIERAHHLGKTGLDEARRAIGMLRDDDLPGPEQLKALVEQFERDSGIRCELAISGTEHALDSEASLAIYRVAQEALTNVRKHGRPERVEVALVYASDRTCLTVEDFGPDAAGPDAAGPDRSEPAGAPPEVKLSGGGYGLTGMRERAELLGGSLTAAPTARGFRVELQVPA
jgi:signal transduction histidine kinase